LRCSALRSPQSDNRVRHGFIMIMFMTSRREASHGGDPCLSARRVWAVQRRRVGVAGPGVSLRGGPWLAQRIPLSSIARLKSRGAWCVGRSARLGRLPVRIPMGARLVGEILGVLALVLMGSWLVAVVVSLVLLVRMARIVDRGVEGVYAALGAAAPREPAVALIPARHLAGLFRQQLCVLEIGETRSAIVLTGGRRVLAPSVGSGMWEVRRFMATRKVSVTVTLAEPLSRFRKLEWFEISKSDSELLPEEWPR